MRAFLAFVICSSLLLYPADTFSQSDEICCTWINMAYASGDRPPKMIFNYDGTYETYRSKEAADPIMRGVYQIVQKWTDADGVIWYKVKMFDMYGTKHQLTRISPKGDSLEFVQKPYEYPKTIDHKDQNYSTYSRFSTE
jgi:hypothetical protein